MSRCQDVHFSEEYVLKGNAMSFRSGPDQCHHMGTINVISILINSLISSGGDGCLNILAMSQRTTDKRECIVDHEGSHWHSKIQQRGGGRHGNRARDRGHGRGKHIGKG